MTAPHTVFKADLAGTRGVINEKYQRLLEYLSTAPLATYDPNDYMSVPWISRLFIRRHMRKDALASLLVRAVQASVLLAPVLSRRMLRLKPIVMSDALGFYVQALCDAYTFDHDERHLQVARPLLAKITGLSVGPPGLIAIGNTYDYPIYDTVIPINTPCVYGTTQVGLAFLKFWQVTHDPGVLPLLTGIRDALLQLFSFTQHPGGGISISYTALDKHTILNVSAMAASYLFAVHNIAADPEGLARARGMLRFVIAQQQEDGSWPYSLNHPLVDNHHTGMMLQALAISLPLVDNAELSQSCRRALIKGMHYYVDNLYTPDLFPKMYTYATYPLDMGSIIEAIAAFDETIKVADLLDRDVIDKISAYWLSTIQAAVRYLACRDGSFATRYYPHYPPFKMNIHSLRCGNAWALRALALTLAWLDQRETVARFSR